MSEPTRPQKAVVADKPRRKLLALKIVTLVVVVIAVVAILPAVVATVYTPGCTSCHAAETKAQNEGPHNRVTCESCHKGATTAQRFAFRQTVMYGMVLKIFPVSSVQASVSNESCSQCHKADTIGTGSNGMVTAKGLQIAHVPCTKGQQCTDCHGGTGHLLSTQIPVSYSMGACVACHNENQTDSSNCAKCHVGGTQNAAQAASKFTLSTFSTTHGVNWQKMHGAGDLSTCTSCHPQSDCARCHGALVPHDIYIVQTHGKVAANPAARQKCYTCHTDQKFCDNCHGLPMPHPANFLTTHIAETKKVGEATCYNCHAKSDCDNCHAAHVHPGGAGL